MGVRGYFGDIHMLECSAELLDTGDQDTSKPWHTEALQLSDYNLSDFNEVPTETSALGYQVMATLDFYGSNDGYKNYDLAIILSQCTRAFTKSKWPAFLQEHNFQLRLLSESFHESLEWVPFILQSQS